MDRVEEGSSSGFGRGGGSHLRCGSVAPALRRLPEWPGPEILGMEAMELVS